MYIKSFRQGSNLLMKSVTGHALEMKGQAKLQFYIGNELISHEFCVVSNATKPMILGSDFFIGTGAKIDLKNKTLALGENVVILRDNLEYLRDKLGVPNVPWYR